MMRNYVYVGTSIDGYIADAEGGVEWLERIDVPDGEDLGFADFMSGIDAVVMGRVTFETLIGFGTGWHYGVPGIILSSTMTSAPKEFSDHVTFTSGTPKEVVTLAKKMGYENLYIDGGQTVQRFLREDLIDEMIITELPVLLGDGISLFGKQTHHIDFELIGAEVLIDQIIKKHYRRNR